MLAPLILRHREFTSVVDQFAIETRQSMVKEHLQGFVKQQKPGFVHGDDDCQHNHQDEAARAIARW